jgi:hypothetical protein
LFLLPLSFFLLSFGLPLEWMQEKQLETSGRDWAELQPEPMKLMGLQQGAKPEKNNIAGFSSSGVFLGQGIGLFWSQQSAPA